jgi:ABC-type lipoprotein release transport system permease subunit
MMRALPGIVWTGLSAVLQYPARSLATVACLVVLLLPFVTGLAISRGLVQQAEDSARLGPDLDVTGTEMGREVPIPVQAANTLRGLDGVRAVVPRIVAPITLGKYQENAVLVGLPREHFPAGITCVEGRLPQTSDINELVVGTELAQRLGLHVGSWIPPFYHNEKGERNSQVVGLFRADVPLWQARLILTTFKTASILCDQKEDLATDLLVYCRPGYEDNVQAAIFQLPSLSVGQPPARISLQATTRADLLALLPRGLLHREGIFNLHYLLLFSGGILVLLVTSGMGSAERRHEIGILKATGWQTDEVLCRSLVESLCLSLTGAALAVLLALAWLRGANGYWIASVFLSGVGMKPTFPIPFRLTPVPVLLCFLLSVVLVLSGTLLSTWRSAVVPPRQALR